MKSVPDKAVKAQTVEVKSGRVLTCDTVRSWRLYSSTPLGNQVASTITQYSTQSHYLDIEQTSPCSILLMLSAKLSVGNIGKWEILRLEQDSNPRLEFQASVLTITQPWLPDVTTLPMPTCLCASLPEVSTDY